MTTFQKVAMGVVGVAALTTLVYPNHQTPDVIKASGTAASDVLSTAEGLG